VDLLSKTFSRRYYGTDNTLRVVQRYAATYQENNQVAIPERRGVFEEYRYDPLGRRVMVYSRRPNPGLCNHTTLCVSSTDLFIWNGKQLHGETYRGSWRPYVHGLGIDRPLKIDDIIPHADFRGQYELGSYASGCRIRRTGRGSCIGGIGTTIRRPGGSRRKIRSGSPED
jgi:hypothetical protein